MLDRFISKWYRRLMRPKPNQDHRQLTPQECQQLSAGTQDLEYPLSVTEAERIEEDVWKRPLKYGTPAEAIAAMQRRITDLRTDKAQILDTLDAYRFQQNHEN